MTKAGQRLHGFTIIDVREIPELKATGVFARHDVTGCEVYHLLNDDEENLFAYSFMTPPEDSTGVAHILEHSVLCGSERYPLKDPFMVLAKQSVKTFLNAMTFPDKTVYPASSMVEADYVNLMSVYGDAVFFPLLEEWVFLQEGHRFEIGANGKASIQGVVFNEMRGNYSSFDSIAGDWSLRSLLPGTPYEHDSGGDPADIPALTYEGFRAFHAKYYHPVNCKIFLSGNIATERQLALLQERFLSRFGPAEKPKPGDAVKPFACPIEMEVPAPAGEQKDGASATVMLNWLLSDSTDTVRLLEANLVSELLLGHDGAPLSRALLESGLGEDIAPSSGLETEIRHMCFSVGLRGVARERAKDFERLVMETMSAIARDGFADEELETAIRSIDFSNREVRRSGGPFALTLMRRSLRGWIHGLEPDATLRYIPAFEEVKRRVAADPTYVGSLVGKWFVENAHRSLVTVYPDAEYDKGLDERLASRIRLFDASLDADARRAFVSAQEAFFAAQKRADSEDVLSRIPHLSRADLPLVTEHIATDISFSNGVPVLTHEQPTNGIAYVDIAIPVDNLSAGEYMLLPMLSSILTNMGLGSLTWVETSALSARVTGGLGTMLFTSSTVPRSVAPDPLPEFAMGRDYLMLRVKALDELSGEAIDLAFRFLEEADFRDAKRLMDILVEYRNDLDSSIAPSGHQYAVSRASYASGISKTVDELWNGLTQIAYVRELCAACSDTQRVAELAQTLDGMRKRLLGQGMVINATGTAASISRVLGALERHTVAYSAPVPMSPRDGAAFLSLARGKSPEDTALELVTSALQVGFAACALPSSEYGSDGHPVDTVFGHWLANGPLWEKVRTAGGAYGVFAYPDSLENVFVFSTYRDPNPLRSFASFRESLEEAASTDVDPVALDKTVNGAYSREVQPRAPADKGFTAFIRTLYGITDDVRKAKLKRLVSVNGEDIKLCAKRLLGDLPAARGAALGGKKMLKDAKPAFFSGNVAGSTV